MQFNDLGHPLCGHLRAGSWAMDYIYERLERLVFAFGFVPWS
jgi:glycogen debranching enzyme